MARGGKGAWSDGKPPPAGLTGVVHHRAAALGAVDRDGGRNASTKELVLQLLSVQLTKVDLKKRC